MPSGVKKCVERFLTSSRFLDLAAFVSRCSRVMRAASSGVKSRLTASSAAARSLLKLLLSLELGIERVPETVAKEGEAHQRRRDEDAGQVDQVRVRPHELLADRDQAAPRRPRRLDANADERERGLGQDGGRDAERDRDDDRSDRVRQEMARDDGAVADAERLGSLDELGL